MSKLILKAQHEVFKALAGKIDDFYLVGGTALSLFYFNHRQSDDLDFFTQEFSALRIRETVDLLKRATKKEARLIAENLSKGRAELMIYNLKLSKGEFLKIDFVRDVLPLARPLKLVDGIKILSLEDIYMRKIYAISGALQEADETGRKRIIGARQEAKDLFDIYFLSHTFLRLSQFADTFCDQNRKEGIIRWFKTFDRTQMKADLADIKTDKHLDFRTIDKHIAEEIDRILRREIGL
ncbi:nucleotidyl transferase AbiEii/AbiGii toxin family protein [Candidatus Omnitrophota bacterium]